MKRLTLLLLAAILILTGVVSLLGWDIAAFILLGAFGGGIVFGFIMPRLDKKYALSKPEPLQTTSQEDKSEIVERITVKTGQKIDIIEVKDIVFIQANGDYVSIYTEKGVWLKEMTMKETERILPLEHFVRVHRSFIVNVACIRAIDRYKKGQYLITLSNKEEVKMTDVGYQVLKQRLAL
ncbi:MAG: LytTR family transcriptional regulator [Bacteroidales bacterium]|jgi:DNA-binding LytR/AlgR family response regulator|nr:LytTR family transcriptional regulator [Bacteroidales bacterium]